MTGRHSRDIHPLIARIIDARGGDADAGMCLCPAHDDNNPSLSLKVADSGKLLVKCFAGCSQEAVIAALRRHGLWPGSSDLEGAQASLAAEQKRTPEERRQHAVKVWNTLNRQNEQRPFLELIGRYFRPRGLKTVPKTAVFAFPTSWSSEVHTNTPGIVLPIRDKTGKLQAIQVTWLDWSVANKREQKPQRQTYGLLKGNFIDLTELDYKKPPAKLIVGEGAETVLAAMQLTEVPGIAAAGKVANVDPPMATEYIILVDVDETDGSRKAGGSLAQRLVGSTVRIATPTRPEGGKPGYDWNDALLDAGYDAAKLAELKRSILEEPLFEQVQTAEEKREIRLNALAALRLDDKLAYYEQRKEVAKELKLPVAVLDDEIARRGELIRTQKAEAGPPPVDIEQLAASARDIIASEDVLELFAHETDQIITGEKENRKILYLICTSRLFDKTMHAAVKGTSAAGKSQIRATVVDYFPPEAVYRFTALSAKALLYDKDDFQHKILSMGEAVGTDEQKFQDYTLRELMSEGKVTYRVPQKIGDGQYETVIIEKNGPVAFLVTTTRNALNPENETRMLSLEIDDSETQTRAVIEIQAETLGLNKKLEPGSHQRWHDYQRWLAAGEVRVIVPFAPSLARLIRKGTQSVRLRRDFPQLLIAIKAHALLHREHRQREADGVIVATISDDYRVVRALMADVLATGVELKMPEAIIETVDAVRELDEGKGATVRQIADHLGLDQSTARRRLRRAEFQGFVSDVEEHKGRGTRQRYECTDQTPTTRGDLLPTPENLERAYTTGAGSEPDKLVDRNVSDATGSADEVSGEASDAAEAEATDAGEAEFVVEAEVEDTAQDDDVESNREPRMTRMTRVQWQRLKEASDAAEAEATDAGEAEVENTGQDDDVDPNSPRERMRRVLARR